MSRVWVRSGFRLGAYTKVMLVGAGIQYRPVSPDDPERAASTPLTRAQKLELESLITDAFDHALDRLALEEVSEPGPDVLLVRGSILDVISRLPGNPASPGQAGYWLDSVGQMTFVVELVDSESNAVLVRGTDTRSARVPGQETLSGADGIRQLVTRWADMLVDALNDLTAIEERGNDT